MVTILKGIETWYDVCYSCYNAHEEDNPFGPGRQLGRDGFKRVCTHLRNCNNAICSPLETEIQEKTKCIAARIFSDSMNDGDEYDQEAVGILIQAGIKLILEDNRFGLRPRDTILNGRVPRLFQITHLLKLHNLSL